MPVAATAKLPRTLYVWTKSDDKALLKGIGLGHTVLDLAEDLQREHVSVIRRLDQLGLFFFEEGTEEWEEIMALGIGGVALQVAIDWCNAAPTRIPYADIEAALMVDFRPELELAREWGLPVPNLDAMTDLTWLVEHSSVHRHSFSAALDAIADRFELPTPTSLKNQLLGIVPAIVTPAGAGRSVEPKPRKRRASTTRRRTFRKKTSTTTYSKARKRRSYSRAY